MNRGTCECGKGAKKGTACEADTSAIICNCSNPTQVLLSLPHEAYSEQLAGTRKNKAFLSCTDPARLNVYLPQPEAGGGRKGLPMRFSSLENKERSDFMTSSLTIMRFSL